MTTVATQDGQMELYEAGDPATASRAIVVIQEAFGLTDHICRCVDRIAAEGYVAVAPALFHRDGAPVLAYDDLEHVMPLMGALSEQGIRMDLDATVGYLASLGFDRASTGIVGFCMGGTVAFRAGTTGMFGAAVTFYGGGVTAGRFGYPPLLELGVGPRHPLARLLRRPRQGDPRRGGRGVASGGSDGHPRNRARPVRVGGARLQLRGPARRLQRSRRGRRMGENARLLRRPPSRPTVTSPDRAMPRGGPGPCSLISDVASRVDGDRLLRLR